MCLCDIIFPICVVLLQLLILASWVFPKPILSNYIFCAPTFLTDPQWNPNCSHVFNKWPIHQPSKVATHNLRGIAEAMEHPTVNFRGLSFSALWSCFLHATLGMEYIICAYLDGVMFQNHHVSSDGDHVNVFCFAFFVLVVNVYVCIFIKHLLARPMLLHLPHWTISLQDVLILGTWAPKWITVELFLARATGIQKIVFARAHSSLNLVI